MSFPLVPPYEFSHISWILRPYGPFHFLDSRIQKVWGAFTTPGCWDSTIKFTSPIVDWIFWIDKLHCFQIKWVPNHLDLLSHCLSYEISSSPDLKDRNGWWMPVRGLEKLWRASGPCWSIHKTFWSLKIDIMNSVKMYGTFCGFAHFSFLKTEVKDFIIFLKDLRFKKFNFLL